MINHKHKFIFIHVSKTGGTSIEHALNPNVSLDYSDNSNTTGNTAFKDKHWSALKYKRECPKEYESYFKFAFVRNPWDRLVSNYKWLVYIGKEQLDFKDWIINPTWGFNAYLYSRMLCDNNGNKMVDFIGKFENLQEDFNTVCEKIGIPCQQLPHKNKTDHKHYTKYYNNETRQIVAERYAKDIKCFGYTFGE